MKIALCHSRPVPPQAYGGSERVVHWLSKGLLELGHEVFLLAPLGSRPARGVQWTPIDARRSYFDEVRSCLPQGIDIIHSSVPMGEQEESLLPAPLVTTIHGNGKPEERFSSGAIFVSENHAQRHGRTAFVHNGIDPEEFFSGNSLRQQSRRGLVFLSKTSWRVKNLRGAFSLARQAGVSLQVGGGSRPFFMRLEALLRPSWKWWGPVGGVKKAELLSAGKALVFPVLWEEPFGLVVVEALCSGTPVLATPRGSLSELIDSTVGRLIPWDQPEEWLETIQALDSGRIRFDPEVCRDYVLRRFHYLRMAGAYVAYYKRRLSGEF